LTTLAKTYTVSSPYPWVLHPQIQPTVAQKYLKIWAWWLMPVIPATQEAEIWRSLKLAWTKSYQIPSQEINWRWWCTPVTPAMPEVQIEGSLSEAGPK
jgi:hypothetical protein